MSRNAIVNHKNSPWTTSKLFNCTRWGQLWDHTHEQHFACSQPVSRLITFPPTSWLLLPWQAKSVRKSQRRRGQSRDIKTGHISEIPMPLLVSSAVTHHASALHFRDLAPFHTTGTNCQRRLSQPMYLGVSPFCTRSRGLVLKSQSLPHRVNWKPSPCSPMLDSTMSNPDFGKH